MRGDALNLVGRCRDVNMVGKHLSRSYFPAAKSKAIHRHAFVSEPNDATEDQEYDEPNDPTGQSEHDRYRGCYCKFDSEPYP